MLIKAGLFVLSGTLLGRLLGFLREAQLAAAFGAGQRAEAAIITLTLPDLLMNILLGGALSYALIPEFARMSESKSWQLHVQLTVLAALLFGFLAFLISFFPSNIIYIFNQQLPDDLAKQTHYAISISAWLMPLIGMAGVTTAYLQTNNRFLSAAFSTSIYNGILVVCLFGITQGLLNGDELIWLAGAMIGGGLVRYLVLWINSKRYMPRGQLDPGGWLVKSSLMKSYLLALLGSAAILSLPLIGRIFAAQYGEGALAQFNYASKLIELPLGVAISVISVVALPALAKAHQVSFQAGQSEHTVEWQTLLFRSLRFSILLSIVIMLPCIWFAASLADIAFGWGKMDSASLDGVAKLTTVGFVLLLLQGGISITSAALASAKGMRMIAWSGLVGMLAFASMAIISIRQGGLIVLMYALILAYSLVLLIQMYELGEKHHIRWKLFMADTNLNFPLLAVLSAFAMLSLLFDRFQENPWIGLSLAAMFTIVLSVVVLAASSEIKHKIFRR